MAAVRDCGFELVDHPPYSPDLAPFDYFRFPNNMNPPLKKKKKKKKTGFQALQHWWKNCVDRRGDYGENFQAARF